VNRQRRRGLAVGQRPHDATLVLVTGREDLVQIAARKALAAGQSDGEDLARAAVRHALRVADAVFGDGQWELRAGGAAARKGGVAAVVVIGVIVVGIVFVHGGWWVLVVVWKIRLVSTETSTGNLWHLSRLWSNFPDGCETKKAIQVSEKHSTSHSDDCSKDDDVVQSKDMDCPAALKATSV